METNLALLGGTGAVATTPIIHHNLTPQIGAAVERFKLSKKPQDVLILDDFAKEPNILSYPKDIAARLKPGTPEYARYVKKVQRNGKLFLGTGVGLGLAGIYGGGKLGAAIDRDVHKNPKTYKNANKVLREVKKDFNSVKSSEVPIITVMAGAKDLSTLRNSIQKANQDLKMWEKVKTKSPKKQAEIADLLEQKRTKLLGTQLEYAIAKLGKKNG